MTEISEQSKKNVDNHIKGQVMNLSVGLNIFYEEAVEKYKGMCIKMDKEFESLSFKETIEKFDKLLQ